MTDIMSEAFGRELVSRVTFEKESIWLPLLAVHHLNAGQPILRGKTFTDCVIEGPVLAAIIDNVRFDGCNMGVLKDPKSLFFRPLGPVAVGAIGLSDCQFLRCRFVQVGFVADDTVVEAMTAMLTPLPGGAA